LATRTFPFKWKGTVSFWEKGGKEIFRFLRRTREEGFSQEEKENGFVFLTILHQPDRARGGVPYSVVEGGRKAFLVKLGVASVPPPPLPAKRAGGGNVNLSRRR